MSSHSQLRSSAKCKQQTQKHARCCNTNTPAPLVGFGDTTALELFSAAAHSRKPPRLERQRSELCLRPHITSAQQSSIACSALCAMMPVLEPGGEHDASSRCTTAAHVDGSAWDVVQPSTAGQICWKA